MNYVREQLELRLIQVFKSKGELMRNADRNSEAGTELDDDYPSQGLLETIAAEVGTSTKLTPAQLR